MHELSLFCGYFFIQSLGAFCIHNKKNKTSVNYEKNGNVLAERSEKTGGHCDQTWSINMGLWQAWARVKAQGSGTLRIWRVKGQLVLGQGLKSNGTTPPTPWCFISPFSRHFHFSNFYKQMFHVQIALVSTSGHIKWHIYTMARKIPQAFTGHLYSVLLLTPATLMTFT